METLRVAQSIEDLVSFVHAADRECRCVLGFPVDELDAAAISGVRDWVVSQTDSGAVFHASKTSFLPKEDETAVLRRKPDRFIMYILCPSRTEYDAAIVNFAPHPWAVPIIIPTTFYLESVMYYHILPRRRDEWEHADYVGTLAHSAHKKLSSIGGVLEVMREGRERGSDVVAFMYRYLPLLQVAEAYHPGFSKIWTAALQHHGFRVDAITATDIPPFYCNYWAATPRAMQSYIDFFTAFRITLETAPDVREAIWDDSQYHRADKQTPRISRDRCVEIWGTPHYPFHPFVCERVPCVFFHAAGVKILAAPL